MPEPRTATVERAAVRLGTLDASTAPAAVCAAVAEESTRIAGAASTATVARYDRGGLIVVAASGAPARDADAAAVNVPIVLGGRLWGTLTVRAAGPARLPPETQERLEPFAELAAAAIANAYAREAARRLTDEQTALRRVATLVARYADLERVCRAAVAEAGALLGADVAAIIRYEPGNLFSAVATWSAAGELPVVSGSHPLGDGDLSARVARTGEPVRVDDWSADGSRWRGMALTLGLRSSVACPIAVGEHLWGAVMVHTRRDEPLAPDTESRLANFAELMATAVANADARREVRRLADEQAALRRVATLVARQASPEDVFAAVVEETLTLLGGDDVRLVRYEDDGETVTLLAGRGALAHAVPVGSRQPLTGRNMPTLVREARAPVRNDAYSGTGSTLAAQMTRAGVKAAAAAPIFTDRGLWGALIVATLRTDPLPAGIETRIAEFCELLATAIANVEARSALAASRARIVAATDEARRRLERDLHDGAQQRLVSLALQLRSAEAMTPPGLAAVRAQIAGVADGLNHVVDDLREISRGIHPAILSEGGLGAAIRALARRSAVPTRVSDNVPGRLDERVEVAAYYAVSEALANAVKHADATHVEVAVTVGEAALEITVSDDGSGGADAEQGSGLVGVRDRAEAVGGRLTVSSPPGLGTTITVALPLAPALDTFGTLLAGG